MLFVLVTAFANTSSPTLTPVGIRHLSQMQCRLHIDQYENLVKAAQDGCATVAALLARAVDDRLDAIVTH